MAANVKSAQRPAQRGSKGRERPQHWRERMIAEAAYFISQRRGFVGGDPLEDWLIAEREIDRQIDAPRLTQSSNKMPAPPWSDE